ncbi:MAG: hypothetical protein NC117_04295 [Pseudoflavonifractor sp.]|nr:hypothetical protein [Pseudoflavonifractor sp.]
MGSVYLTLFLDSQKLRNFLISVKDAADGRCLSGYVYSALRGTGVSWSGVSIFYVRPLQVCSFD